MEIPAEYHNLHQQLIRLTQAWALRRPVHLHTLKTLRRQAILANHAHYLETIPAYQNLARQSGIDAASDLESIQQKMMLPDEIFKSYNQQWLDDGRFDQMTAWLGEIFHRRVELETAGIASIDEWIARLDQQGIHLVYSSGTSGNFSFIPRDAANWSLFRRVSTCYLAPLLTYEKIGSWWQRLAVRLAVSWLSPSRFAAQGKKMGVGEYDAVFLDFNRGRTGNQTLVRELAPLFRKHCFLYEANFSPSVLRLATRGAKTPADQALLEQLRQVVVERSQENYQRIIHFLRQATQEGQKIFIFGAPQQTIELCTALQQSGQTLALPQQSLLLFGGGWKSFTGKKISRPELLTLIGESLHLLPERILEGYSMTEINAFMLRCDFGRFHIPPFIEPVLFDEELAVLPGASGRGIFGFQDPFAYAYPGFVISGDEVTLVDGECACGLNGAAVTQIGRAREVKGCGGILTSVAG